MLNEKLYSTAFSILLYRRSAELCEANQKQQFLKTEGFSSRSTVYCNTIG